MPPPGKRGNVQDDGVPRLSCELCRHRKLKCDKLDPCSNCVSSKSVCVPVRRLRRSRGRHVPRSAGAGGSVSENENGAGHRHPGTVTADDSLASRINRLESLIMRMDPTGEAMKTLLDGEGSTRTRTQTGGTSNLVRNGTSPNLQSLGEDIRTKPNESFMQRFGYFWTDLVEEVRGIALDG